MTAVVARLLAALRVLRRAGRRRALRVVVFLGGLLALGFLWGGQAYAVEAPLPPHDSTTGVVDAVADPAAQVAAVASTAPAAPTALAVPSAPVHVQVPQKSAVREAGRAVRGVAEPVADADVVRGVAAGVGELKDRVAERRRPVAPEVAVPSLPVRALPVRALPVRELPAREVSVAEVPVTESAVVSTPPSRGGTEPPVQPEKSVHRGSGDRAQLTGSGFVTGVAGLAGRGVSSYEATASHRDDAACGEAPVQAPAGPCGDGVTQSAGDGPSSRSGDKHAAMLAGGARFGLVRGATLPATIAPTYDRPNEILEFPG